MTVSLGFQTDKTAAEYASLAVAAETFGFDGVSVFNDLGYQPSLYPLLVMAQHTSRVRLGAACLNPYLTHPVEIAGQVAALDQLSGGRAYVGLTRGSWLDGVGVTPDRPLTALREAVALIAAFLRGEEFQGEVFLLPQGFARYPVHRARVDVLLGVWGPRGAEVAAACADEVKLGGCANPDMVALMCTWLGDAPTGVVAGAVTVVDEDRATARARARTEVAMYVDVVAALDRTVTVDPDLTTRLRTLVAAGAHTEAGTLIPDDLLDRFCFAGTPDEVAEHAHRLFAAGATRVEFGTPHGTTDRHGVELLGRKVLPQLTG